MHYAQSVLLLSICDMKGRLLGTSQMMGVRLVIFAPWAIY